MNIKNSLRQEIKIIKYTRIGVFLFLIAALIILFFFGSVLLAENDYLLTLLTTTIALLLIIQSIGQEDKIKLDLHIKITNINELIFYTRVKRLLHKKDIYTPPIFFKKLNKELQNEALIKLSKKELSYFEDFFEIYTNPIFKDILLEQYPKELHDKLFIKLNKFNFLKLLKDVPKTKIDDFLEDKVKKTIA